MGRELSLVQLSVEDSTSSSSPSSVSSVSSEYVAGELQALGRRLCMHVVAAKPTYLSPRDVPPPVMQAEAAIYRSCLHMCL